jgi:hypothetical protein
MRMARRKAGRGGREMPQGWDFAKMRRRKDGIPPGGKLKMRLQPQAIRA